MEDYVTSDGPGTMLKSDVKCGRVTIFGSATVWCSGGSRWLEIRVEVELWGIGSPGCGIG